MSLSWLDRLSLFVHPAEAVLVRRTWRGKVERHMQAVPATRDGEPAWQAAVETALGLLAGRAGRGAGLRIVVANPFVRYALLPWSDAVIGDKARRALALALLRSNLGEQAGQFEMALDRPVFGRNGVAAALDRGMLEALRQGARVRHLRLAAIRPQLGADLAALRPQAGDGCLLFEDDDWLTLVGLQGGNVCLLRNCRAAGSDAQRQGEMRGMLAMHAQAVSRKSLQIFTGYSWPSTLDDWRVECRKPLGRHAAHA